MKYLSSLPIPKKQLQPIYSRPVDWKIYIVKCSDDTYYTGITNDLTARINKHNSGKGAKYTKTRTPVQLMYSETVLTKSEALKREYQIKRLTRKQKEELIKS